MPIGAIGGAISGIGSLIGGVLGHGAAQDAASQQANAGNKAIGVVQQAGQQANEAQTQQIAQERATSQPFIGMGQQSADYLSQLLAPGGALTQGWNQTFSAPTAEQAAATPGYQFQLQQGLNALQNSAAARGGLLSTGTAKNLNNYAQGTAASNYQNVFNNALNAYGTNFGTFQANQNNLYNRLYGAAGLGSNAAANLNSVTQSGTGNLTNNLLSTANMVGNDIMGIGNAQAAGTIGGANALIGGLQGGMNALGGGITLSQLLGAQNAGGGNYPGQTYTPGMG